MCSVKPRGKGRRKNFFLPPFLFFSSAAGLYRSDALRDWTSKERRRRRHNGEKARAAREDGEVPSSETEGELRRLDKNMPC